MVRRQLDIELPSDWRILPFEACATQGGIDRKPSVQQADYKPAGRFPVVDQGSGLVAGYTDEEELAYKNDLPLILFGDHTRAFKFLDFPFATGADGTKLLRADERVVDPLFLYYALLHVEIPSRGYSRHFKYLKENTIAIPSERDEQRAISGVLAKIQATVEVQEKIVATLKELKAATMAKLFREGLRGEPLKQTEVGEIPESWRVIKLGEYCSISSGGTPSRDKAEYWNGNIPWVKTGEIEYRPIAKTEEYITEAGLRNSSARVFPKGTLLMAMYGQGVTRGKVAFMAIDAATNQACAALFPRQELDSGYLYAYCAFAYERIRELGHGANQRNLSADLIREIRLPLPPTSEEQWQIYSDVKSVESRIQAAEEARDRLKTLFRSMLGLLMTGQVRVPQAVRVEGHRVEAPVQSGWRRGDPIALEKLSDGVERFVAELVRRFEPERVILFGSHAEGSATADSDVDLLVVMPFEGRGCDQAARIDCALERDFPLDLLVRRPEAVREALARGDPFMKEIVEKGKVLYARPE